MLGHVSEGLLSCRGSRKQLPEKTVEKSGNKNPNKSDGPNELCAGFGADHSARCQLQLQPPSIRVFSIYPRLTGAIIPALLLRANHPPHFRGCWPSAAKITLFHPRFPRVFYKRSFQSHRSSQGEVSLIKRNKTPFFPPQLLLGFLSTSTNIPSFHGGEEETEARGLWPRLEHHSHQLHPDPRSLDPVSGFGRVLGPGSALGTGTLLGLSCSMVTFQPHGQGRRFGNV